MTALKTGCSWNGQECEGSQCGWLKVMKGKEKKMKSGRQCGKRVNYVG